MASATEVVLSLAIYLAILLVDLVSDFILHLPQFTV